MWLSHIYSPQQIAFTWALEGIASFCIRYSLGYTVQEIRWTLLPSIFCLPYDPWESLPYSSTTCPVAISHSHKQSTAKLCLYASYIVLLPTQALEFIQTTAKVRSISYNTPRVIWCVYTSHMSKRGCCE